MQLGFIKQACITTAGKLPAKFVIHTVVPVWNDGDFDEENLLSLAYSNSLKLAIENHIQTMAFPHISMGIYHFPKDRSAKVAIITVMAFLQAADARK